jgi:hypothetical protein
VSYLAHRGVGGDPTGDLGPMPQISVPLALQLPLSPLAVFLPDVQMAPDTTPGAANCPSMKQLMGEVDPTDPCQQHPVLNNPVTWKQWALLGAVVLGVMFIGGRGH